MILPSDVVELIVRHASAMRIQAVFRIHMYRHAKKRAFARLRRVISSSLNGPQFDELSRQSLVRREWRCDPNAWIEEFVTNPRLFHIVLAEVRQDLWRATPRPGGT